MKMKRAAGALSAAVIMAVSLTGCGGSAWNISGDGETEAYKLCSSSKGTYLDSFEDNGKLSVNIEVCADDDVMEVNFYLFENGQPVSPTERCFFEMEVKDQGGNIHEIEPRPVVFTTSNDLLNDWLSGMLPGIPMNSEADHISLYDSRVSDSDDIQNENSWVQTMGSELITLLKENDTLSVRFTGMETDKTYKFDIDAKGFAEKYDEYFGSIELYN